MGRGQSVPIPGDHAAVASDWEIHLAAEESDPRTGEIRDLEINGGAKEYVYP